MHQKLQFLMSDYKQTLSHPASAIVANGGSIPPIRVILPNTIASPVNKNEIISTTKHILSDFDASSGNIVPTTQDISSNSMERPSKQKKPHLSTRSKTQPKASAVLKTIIDVMEDSEVS